MALLTKVRARLGIHARRKVFGLLEGGYASVHTGRSMDFNDLREYVPGDEVKDIDWKASARGRQLLVKRYVAERKHTVLLVVPTGREFAALANPQETKGDLAVLTAGMIGYLAVRHGDYVGLYAGTGDQPHAARPSTREIALERMLHQILDGCTAEAPATDLAGVLDFVVRTVSRRTIMLLVTQDVDLDDQALQQLRRLRVQHEVLVLAISDLDVADPALTGRVVRDVADGRRLPSFVGADARLSAELAAQSAERQERRRAALDQLGIASAQVSSSDDALGAVMTLLDRHRHAA